MRALALLLSLACSLIHCERHEPATQPARVDAARPKARAAASEAADRATPADARAGDVDPTVSPPPSPLTFSAAKRELRVLYRKGEHHTLYADCSFSSWQLDWASCCYQPPPGPRRRLEWEHVVPAAALGRELPSWRTGDPACLDSAGKPFHGRRCARRASETFRHMEGDMHNLFPTIGALNEARAAHVVGLIDHEPRAYGSCDFEIAAHGGLERSGTRGRVEPRPAARGDVARAYLYMSAAYPRAKLLDPSLRAMLLRWHRADPADDWERRRNDYIASRQGNRNPWVDLR